MNQLLAKASEAILAKVDQRLHPVVQKVVEQGKRVMYDEKTRPMAMHQLKAAKDPESIGAAVAKLAGILFNQSRNTLPMEVLMPAATLLLCEALGFLEEAGVLQVDNDLLAKCTMAMSSAFLQLMGVTPEKLQELAAQRGQAGIVSGAMGG